MAKKLNRELVEDKFARMQTDISEIKIAVTKTNDTIEKMLINCATCQERIKQSESRIDGVINKLWFLGSGIIIAIVGMILSFLKMK